MRIIGGQYRRRRLKSPPSSQTRPTSDRLRETLFNVLAPRMGGARFLDLCAGSGAVGLEALSRGAAQVTFVDQSRKMCELIRANLQALEIDENVAQILTVEASEFLRRHSTENKLPPFDTVYFDPPYADDYHALHLLSETARTILTDNAIVVVEHYKKKDLPADLGALNRYRELKQGDSKLSFYKIIDR